MIQPCSSVCSTYCSNPHITKPLDLNCFCFSNPGGTIPTKCHNALLGRYPLSSILPNGYLSITTGTINLTIPPNYVIFFYPNSTYYGYNPSSAILGQYYIDNGATIPESIPINTLPNTADITGYVNSDTIVDVQRYSNDTFVTNCIYSFSVLGQHFNRGGVNFDVCGGVKDTDGNIISRGIYTDLSLRSQYPFSGVGEPPASPVPDEYTPPPAPLPPQNNDWVWVLVGAGVLLLVLIVMLVGFFATRSDPVPKVVKYVPQAPTVPSVPSVPEAPPVSTLEPPIQ